MIKVVLYSMLFYSLASFAQGHFVPSPDYKLYWSDEFDGAALDTTKWNYRLLGQRREAVNVKSAVRLDGAGNLVITTRQVGSEIHTGMIGTQGKFETTYGYFECRVKMQPSQGHWSAFWLQSPEIKGVGDPGRYGCEIDIFECFEPQKGLVEHNLHWDGYGRDHKHKGSGDRKVAGLLDGYHTFGLEWTPEEYIFYIDGKQSWRTDAAVSHRDQYLVLSLEVDKRHKAVIERNPNFWDSVYFDYVRVYKKSN